VIQAILDSANMSSRRPVVGDDFESNVKDLFIIGDLSGAPVVKLAMEHGNNVAEHIASLPDARTSKSGAWDVIVVGAGAAGLNAALVAQDKGLRVLVLEKNKVANTIEDFPEGKWVYAEPDSRPPKGKLWLDGARKEDLLTRWHQIIRDNKLNVRSEEGVTGIRREKDAHFTVTTPKESYTARRVILATGQRGNPRKLGVPGEDREQVYHRLYSPGHYQGEDILVVGGGNSAVEAAVTLAERNRVTLSYRGPELSRVFKDNERKLREAVDAGRVQVIYNSKVKSFGERTCAIEAAGAVRELPYQHAFVLVGAELPTDFLKSLGLKLENEWSVGRYALLLAAFLICYTIYGVKRGAGSELWPFKDWGHHAFSFFDRPVSFWYTVLYTALMTVFGIQAMKRWGFDRKDRFQIWRYTSLIAFQWIFFFLVPEFLFQYAVKYQWVGQLAKDPVFADQAWRSYGIIYAWPLFLHTFLNSPHQIWVVWGVLLTFGILPLFALFHGKRYCSWICGCGGLAETFGDRWRHLAPKGRTSVKWEWMNMAVLIAAAAVTLMALLRDTVELFRTNADTALGWYGLIADLWLVGIIPVTLYPFLGGKVWCRYWCPLAKLMHLYSAAFSRFRVSRFAIHSNDKCIGCGECTRNCQVGIDVMNFALKQEVLNNHGTSCIGCGICVTVCPMDTLSFQPVAGTKLVQIESKPKVA